MSDSTIIDSADPQWISNEDRWKAVLARESDAERTVRILDRPELPSNTATSQIHMRVVSTIAPPVGQDGSSIPNSRKFPPIRAIEERNFPPGTPLLLDKRRRAEMSSSVGIPVIPAVADYKGAHLEDAHNFRFAGISLTGHDAKDASEAGGEDLMTVQTGGMTSFPHAGTSSIRGCSVVSMGPPAMFQTHDVNTGAVKDDAYTKSNILENRGASRGDFSDCPPVPREIVVSSVADRFFQIHHNWVSDLSPFNKEHLNGWLWDGKVEDGVALAKDAFERTRFDGHQESNAYSSIKSLFDKLKIGLGGQQIAGVDYKYITDAGRDQQDRAVLANAWRAFPGRTGQTEAEALAFYERRLLKRMFKITAFARDPDAQAMMNRSAANRTTLQDLLVRHNCYSAGQPTALAYAAWRRFDLMQYHLEHIAGHAKIMCDIVENYENQAHLLVTADSNPGNAITGLLLLHASS